MVEAKKKKKVGRMTAARENNPTRTSKPRKKRKMSGTEHAGSPSKISKFI
jgi:hypothetical protein